MAATYEEQMKSVNVTREEKLVATYSKNGAQGLSEGMYHLISALITGAPELVQQIAYVPEDAEYEISVARIAEAVDFYRARRLMTVDLNYRLRNGEVTVVMAAGMQFAVRGKVEDIHEEMQGLRDEDYMLFDLAEVEGKMSLRRGAIVMAQRAQIAGANTGPDLVVPHTPLPQGMR